MAAKMVPSSSASATRSQMLDDLIMGTNSSSIVSKRSVERLYYPDEPHYFRYFVKKFQRRAPLINRGYWLRLRAIDVIVRQFLTDKTGRKKVVINLGCGSDVLPWQSHARYGHSCQDALFVDVDYPDLMQKKRTIVLETPQLKELLGDNFTVSESKTDHILLRSDKYCQVGCDLRELADLGAVLESLVDLSDCDVLFVAEVSITYMDTDSTDNLIQWANSVGHAEFCLLEQLLPHGEHHPFAQTMLAHFDKLKTPPRSVKQYPTLATQKERFNSRGWGTVQLWDLWQAWSGNDFVSSEERTALDDVEPFDEWEEFILFARHYIILHAYAQGQSDLAVAVDQSEPEAALVQEEESIPASFERIGDAPKRRFGHCLTTKSPIGQDFTLHMMGLGINGRADTYDVFSFGGNVEVPSLPVTGPVPRMCSTLTDLGAFGQLLVGGRSSPASAFSDCWVFKELENTWRPTWRLPVPLYRHASIRLGSSSLVLVSGGRTGASGISKAYFLFNPTTGWSCCEVQGEVIPAPVLGGLLVNSSETQAIPGKFHGLIAGGIGHDGLIETAQYLWSLDTTGTHPTISFRHLPDKVKRTEALSVFGATCVSVPDQMIVCGGIRYDGAVLGQTISSICASNDGYKSMYWKLSSNTQTENPFMIGASIIPRQRDLLVVGGGATCFSMGTFWETGLYTIQLSGIIAQREHSGKLDNSVTFLESHRVVGAPGDAKSREGPQLPQNGLSTTIIPRVKTNSPADFENHLKNGKPVIVEGLQLGGCVEKWTPDYMVDAVGAEKEVVVHECIRDSDKMDFNSKNFRYVNEPFKSVMDKIRDGGRLYLRSLSQEKPSELPAKLDEDFPNLSTDFTLPPELQYVNKNLFSSILRVSGRVNMWLHYDVMANIYAQVAGSKRMILFPPSDVSNLAFAPGASSSSLNVFSALETGTLTSARPHEALLYPGDVLLLPALWLHTAAPLTDLNVAVNVFFRDLQSGYGVGRDVYGNRDLAVYEKGRLDIARIGRSFQGLPDETRRFYLARLADELQLSSDGG